MRELRLHDEWDPVTRRKRYREREGSEVFLAERRRITMTAHDEAAETAAVRIAAAKWGGKVELQGTGKFRDRMAREAARQGIAVENADLASILENEHERMSRGEPPPAGRGRPDAAIEEEDEQSEDLGR